MIDYFNDFENIIKELEKQKRKLETILLKPVQNKQQEQALKTAKDLLEKVDSLLSSMRRIN